MSDNTLVNETNVTQTEATPNAEIEAPAEKTFTQKEVDDMMARMKGSLTRKLENKYSDLGDVEELHLAKDHINRLLTVPKFNPNAGEEGGEEGGEEMETPEEEPAEEEPAEEEPEA